jgi:hypothetical protein
MALMRHLYGLTPLGNLNDPALNIGVYQVPNKGFYAVIPVASGETFNAVYTINLLMNGMEPSPQNIQQHIDHIKACDLCYYLHDLLNQYEIAAPETALVNTVDDILAEFAKVM